MRELSLNVMDIAQNCIKAGAKLIHIYIFENSKEHSLCIKISDDGCGMTNEQVEKVIDPFFTTRNTRNVGMGIPLFKMAAELTGGNITINSEINKGTSVCAVFKTDSIDMTPLGDINSTISLLIKCNPNLDILFERRFDDKQFSLDTRELKSVLGEVRLDVPEVTDWINEYLREETAKLGLKN